MRGSSAALRTCQTNGIPPVGFGSAAIRAVGGLHLLHHGRVAARLGAVPVYKVGVIG